MADLSVTANEVLKGSGATSKRGTAGETMTAGQLVYLDSTTGNYKLAQADDASTDEIAGITLHGSASGQPIEILTGGTIDLGVTLTVGEVYCLSAGSAGGIAPYGDLVASNYVSVVGIAQTADILLFNGIVSGVAIPA